MLLKNGVYPYEYMDDWEKVNENSLPENEDFYSHLAIEDITDPDYTCVKRVCKDFEIKKFRWIAWFLYSEWYIIANWCISKYAS